MSGYGWLELVFFFVLLAISTPLLSSYMAKVCSNGKAPGGRFFLPVERVSSHPGACLAWWCRAHGGDRSHSSVVPAGQGMVWSISCAPG
jgi:hypothetical protein